MGYISLTSPINVRYRVSFTVTYQEERELTKKTLGSKSQGPATINYDTDGGDAEDPSGSRGNGIDLVCLSFNALWQLMDSG